jgi:hypothetical protein
MDRVHEIMGERMGVDAATAHQILCGYGDLLMDVLQEHGGVVTCAGIVNIDSTFHEDDDTSCCILGALMSRGMDLNGTHMFKPKIQITRLHQDLDCSL